MTAIVDISRSWYNTIILFLIENADDLADQSLIQYGTLRSGSTMTFFRWWLVVELTYFVFVTDGVVCGENFCDVEKCQMQSDFGNVHFGSRGRIEPKILSVCGEMWQIWNMVEEWGWWKRQSWGKWWKGRKNNSHSLSNLVFFRDSKIETYQKMWR